MDQVKKYKKRRDARVKARMDAGEEGRWVTTEKKHKVHINGEGVPDKGNPHVIKVMSPGGRGSGSRRGTNHSNRYSGMDYVDFLEKSGFGKKKDAPTMEDDMKKQGYQKNSEGRWEKNKKQANNKPYGGNDYDPTEEDYGFPAFPSDYDPEEDEEFGRGGNKEYGYGSGDENKRVLNYMDELADIDDRGFAQLIQNAQKDRKISDKALNDIYEEGMERLGIDREEADDILRANGVGAMNEFGSGDEKKDRWNKLAHRKYVDMLADIDEEGFAQMMHWAQRDLDITQEDLTDIFEEGVERLGLSKKEADKIWKASGEKSKVDYGYGSGDDRAEKKSEKSTGVKSATGLKYVTSINVEPYKGERTGDKKVDSQFDKVREARAQWDMAEANLKVAYSEAAKRLGLIKNIRQSLKYPDDYRKIEAAKDSDVVAAKKAEEKAMNKHIRETGKLKDAYFAYRKNGGKQNRDYYVAACEWDDND